MKAPLVIAILALVSLSLSAPATENGAPVQEKQVAKAYVGTLQTGVMAIGGETTGTILKTKDSGAYELDLQGKADLQKTADALNGKKVVVEGNYKPRPGVEVKERRIVVVKSLKEAK